MRKPLSKETIGLINDMFLNSKSITEIKQKLNISYSCVYSIVKNKRYVKSSKGVTVRGLSDSQKKDLKNISKNKSSSVNRLLLLYIKTGISLEPARNKIYED